ncbi:MAG: hypothetical protein OXO52_21610 [Rhodospirillales bacterium]|nr:hypothetical protein [Rhodospirillales bacterium]MDE0381428.1 hypothetical protein [Rhodospirillales bacterium]
MIRTSLPGFRVPVILSTTQPVERKRYRSLSNLGSLFDHSGGGIPGMSTIRPVSGRMVSILPIRATRLYHAARNNWRDAEN